jgi:hypothetical protein
MNFDQLTDQDIDALLKLPKRVVNPKAQWKEKPGHRQKNYTVKGGDYDFQIYLRQNLHDNEDFSCGLKVIKPDGQPLTLVRHNGPSHIHGEIAMACHIHRTSARAIREGRKPEHYAEPTNAYTTLEGALWAMARDCAITGLPEVKPDHPDFFF